MVKAGSITRDFFKKILKISIISVALFFSMFGLTFAVPFTGAQTQAIKNFLPGSTEPGVINNRLSPSRQRLPQAQGGAVTRPQEGPSSLGPQANQIKFKLTQIILQDNHVFSDAQLSPIYKNKLNKIISVAELQGIVQDITNYYRNNGYILSRAILPPQHVKNGVVYVKIIEGYIDEVHVIGTPRGARALLEAYGQRIIKSKPLQIKVMDHYLRLANEIPGMAVKAVLEPSKNNVGASHLNLSAQEKTFGASFSYDDYGTRYIGPQQMTPSVAFNSIFNSGDATRVTYSTTPRPTELKFYDVSYLVPAGTKGTYLTFGINNSVTHPQFALEPLRINGDARTYYFLSTYPVIRSREKNLTLDAGLNYYNSQVTSFRQLLYDDRIRTVRVGASYDFADRYKGSNLFTLHVEQGLNIWGATNDPNSLTLSRVDGHEAAMRIVLQALRNQLLVGRFSLLGVVNGQYAFQPLLSAQQFTFGGSQIGRGYDPAEIIGDRGFSGSLELRMDMAPGWLLVKTVQAYVFYDQGIIWNIKNVPNVDKKQSAASTGIGARFLVNPYISGNLMFTQPLTKEVAAQEIIGRGRCPRGFFSVVASI